MVPMNSTIMLPMILGHIRFWAKGFGDVLHSKQTSFPLRGGVAMHGFKCELGKLFWTQQSDLTMSLNKFFCKIGLSMRRRSKNFRKSKSPLELEPLKHAGML